ncbi:MAG: hypothetical protein RMM29_01570 [Planctomycetota bacterium]|nr:hypothetical protein [Planctomycetota bacterium]MDW8372324.1 hypothetical protein [Planctomycetota bacterium]
MSPAQHAAAILAWYAAQDPTALATAYAAAEGALLAHAAALAEAADSADPERQRAGIQALFAGLVEPLNDSFAPAARWLYHRLFTHIVWRACQRDAALAARLASFGVASEEELCARHARVRACRQPLPAGCRRLAVLSRVTIGADVLLTSVLLQRLRQRYPDAELVVLGDGKLQALFGGFPGVRVRPVSYARRGALGERLRAWRQLADDLAALQADAVLAPDSRLDQLGILPLGDEQRYRLWENVQPDERPRSLVDLLNAWCDAVLGADEPALPRLAFDGDTQALSARFRAALGDAPLCAVKLDHGGNPAKALPRQQECALLAGLAARGWRILLDRGFGAEELANSDALLDALGWRVCELDDSGQGLGRAVAQLARDELAAAQVIRFHGSIGGWAAALAACRYAIAYDSVGQHLAAALDIPLSVPFTGWTDPRFPLAWQPRGRGPVRVIAIPTEQRAEARWVEAVLASVPPP